ncbi:MAG: BamA/TamA family outer membrane protein [Spirochaetes bacterium]|nr:BamA/TamA family outer membrane protein [Spirochaetota bacterium]
MAARFCRITAGLLGCVLVYCLIGSRVLAAGKLDDYTLKNKKRGWYFTGMPILNLTSDNGLGYGAGVYFYQNGRDEDPGFDETPYFTQLYGQFFQTTNGWTQHMLQWDQFRLGGTSLRVRACVMYEKKINANYFGIGSRTTRRNLEDGNFAVHDSRQHYYRRFLKDDYRNFARGEWWHFVNYKYDNYGYVQPKGYFNLYGTFTDDAPVLKNFEYLAGFQAGHTRISRWDLRGYRVNGRRFVELNPTRINRERPRGYRGGWTNFIRLGLAFSTIDFEPDPRKGVRIEYCMETSHRFFGSDYVYYRNTFGFRWYQTYYKGLMHVIRFAYTTSARNMPFFEMDRFAFFWNREAGLGGPRTLRGYRVDRFVGKTMTLANFELRYHVVDFDVPLLGRFGIKLVAFVEAGNVYDEPGDPFAHPRWDDYRYCYGGGVVVPWNQSTILHAYVGFSREDYSFSFDFEHGIR